MQRPDERYKGVRPGDGTRKVSILSDTHPDPDLRTRTAHMKTETVVPNVSFSGRRQSLIEDARRERVGSGSSTSPGPSRYGDGFVFEEKDGRVTLNVLFALSNEKNEGFFKVGKIFEVNPERNTKNTGML